MAIAAVQVTFNEFLGFREMVASRLLGSSSTGNMLDYTKLFEDKKLFFSILPAAFGRQAM